MHHQACMFDLRPFNLLDRRLFFVLSEFQQKARYFTRNLLNLLANSPEKLGEIR